MNNSSEPSFGDSGLFSASDLISKNAVLVHSGGNCNNCLRYQPEDEQLFVDIVATGLVLFVAGLDSNAAFGGFHRDFYRVDSSSAVCGGVIRAYCVLAPFTFPDASGNDLSGTSFSAPAVSASLANARLLWPNMTSRQTVQLAQYCARPILSDQTLGNWGTILDETTASQVWGQGVFSVECLYEPNGALVNPITTLPLQGAMVLSGATSILTLTDRFGRDYALSRNENRIPLIDLPDISGFFATQAGILGFAWNKYITLALREEENAFFGSYGTGDFVFGDSWAAIVRLAHAWELTPHIYTALEVQSAYGTMTPRQNSLVRRARGHMHQLTAKMGYRKGSIKQEFVATYVSGVIGKIDVSRYGSLALKPEPFFIAQLKFSRQF